MTTQIFSAPANAERNFTSFSVMLLLRHWWRVWRRKKFHQVGIRRRSVRTNVSVLITSANLPHQGWRQYPRNRRHPQWRRFFYMTEIFQGFHTDPPPPNWPTSRGPNWNTSKINYRLLMFKYLPTIRSISLENDPTAIIARKSRDFELFRNRYLDYFSLLPANKPKVHFFVNKRWYDLVLTGTNWMGMEIILHWHRTSLSRCGPLKRP